MINVTINGYIKAKSEYKIVDEIPQFNFIITSSNVKNNLDPRRISLPCKVTGELAVNTYPELNVGMYAEVTGEIAENKLFFILVQELSYKPPRMRFKVKATDYLEQYKSDSVLTLLSRAKRKKKGK